MLTETIVVNNSLSIEEKYVELNKQLKDIIK